jgi:hypothetical protein
MHLGQSAVLAILAVSLIGDDRAVAQPQPSQSSLQSAMRDIRDTVHGAAPSNRTRASTGISPAGTQVRLEAPPGSGACAQQTRQPCPR